MRIFTFVATDPESPVQAIARIHMRMTDKKGAAGMDWSPMIFGSVTEASARQRAQEWYDGEIAKERAKAEKAALKRPGAKKAEPEPEKEPVQAAVGVVDPGDVI